MLVGMVLLSRMGVNTTNATVVRNMIIMGFGVGLAMPVVVIAVQNAFPHSEVGTVTASIQFFEYRWYGRSCNLRVTVKF